jgi:hypothetical protein
LTRNEPESSKDFAFIRRKLPVASAEEFAIFAALFRLKRRGELNGLKHSGIRVDAGGHNNIEINPVFRGMVFRKRIKIKKKIKIKTATAAGLMDS